MARSPHVGFDDCPARPCTSANLQENTYHFLLNLSNHLERIFGAGSAGSAGTLDGVGTRSLRGSTTSLPTATDKASERGTIVTLPLDGIRVIEVGQALAGPLAGVLLADMGAGRASGLRNEVSSEYSFSYHFPAEAATFSGPPSNVDRDSRPCSVLLVGWQETSPPALSNIAR
ncbi:CoA transferase [Reyranella sp.]|uniref:CoA transferase n=1 Tax=Reyranella sp. TaxID=1929291 RepID=UPI003523DCEA